MILRKTQNLFKQYTESGDIDTENMRSGATFINTGTAKATINNTIILNVQDALVIEATAGEIDETKYFVTFGQTGIKQLTVITTVQA